MLEASVLFVFITLVWYLSFLKTADLSSCMSKFILMDKLISHSLLKQHICCLDLHGCDLLRHEKLLCLLCIFPTSFACYPSVTFDEWAHISKHIKPKLVLFYYINYAITSMTAVLEQEKVREKDTQLMLQHVHVSLVWTTWTFLAFQEEGSFHCWYQLDFNPSEFWLVCLGTSCIVFDSW